MEKRRPLLKPPPQINQQQQSLAVHWGRPSEKSHTCAPTPVLRYKGFPQEHGPELLFIWMPDNIRVLLSFLSTKGHCVQRVNYRLDNLLAVPALPDVTIGSSDASQLFY
ncbi:hypothetical protein XELAEV_18029169mg [Xenopus laevis]|uniref:Uncharacterized protein n=1 Tax=Xenopus laevis TaxID=8355 RepID=A0A974CR73_XENLA|nr:hypothetical protein XELAEV_18029169mg [Xenopus laevis]